VAGRIIPNINGVKHAEKDATMEEVVVAEVVLLVVGGTVKRRKLIGQVLGYKYMFLSFNDRL
jgi:hypothetical protein